MNSRSEAELEVKELYVRPSGRDWNGWRLMDDRKISVDLICSIGGDCLAASQQKLRGLRPYSLPFDWCYSDGETAIVNFAEQLKVNFSGMARKENLRPIPSIRNGYKDIATGYNFIHHFHAPIETAGEYARFKEIFDRRINRLLNEIERSRTVLFILSRVYNLHRECLRPLEKVCRDRWPDKRFYFIMATYNSGESTLVNDGDTMIVRIARDRNVYDMHERVFEWSFLDNVKLVKCES